MLSDAKVNSSILLLGMGKSFCSWPVREWSCEIFAPKRSCTDVTMMMLSLVPILRCCLVFAILMFNQVALEELLRANPAKFWSARAIVHSLALPRYCHCQHRHAQ